ncbi:MAG: PAS domain S-box protein, partial [Methanobacteriota archaeon]
TGNAREYFRKLASYSHDLTFLQDLNGTYQQVHWKNSGEYGIDAGELVGKNPYDLLSKEGAAAYMGYLQEVRKNRQTIERELTFSIKGQSFEFATVLAPVYNESGRVIGVMGSSRDVTTKKGEELARVQLEWEIKHRRDFITTAAHELRTPLQPILGYLHLLLEDPAAYSLDAETTRILRVCLENVERERRIVDRMLELSVLYNGKLQIEASSVPLRELVDTIIAAGGYDQTAEICNEVPPDVEIVADKSCLYQIIQTLISNAVLYNRPPKRAWISYTSDAENHVIAVRDTGIGMEKKVLSSIFKPFYLPDAENLSRPTNRMGLGLSIAQEYIRLHGGRITVSSTVNEGSTFTVYIPKEGSHGP